MMIAMFGCKKKDNALLYRLQLLCQFLHRLLRLQQLQLLLRLQKQQSQHRSPVPLQTKKLPQNQRLT
jgi:hypothetical protein